jgi:Lrp/AsnC family leucine-responsive transcriptional regulator
MKLDLIDRRILKELLQDGRAKYTDIGNKIGVGSSTIRWRIKRLEDEGIIFGYTCLPNIEYFKLNMAIFFLKTSKDIKGVIKELKKQNRLTSIVITFGDSNIVCRGVFQNIDDLLRLKDKISMIEGIGEIQTCITYKGMGMGGEVPLEFIKKTEKLDRIDKQVLEGLIKNARIGYAKLGRKLNLNASTIRLRTVQLIDKGIIRKFTARLNLTRLGRSPAFLRIRTKGGKTANVIKRLVKIQDIMMALPCIGECDVFSRAVVKGTGELNKLINDIINIEGIKNVKADCTIKGERIGGFVPPEMLEILS